MEVKMKRAWFFLISWHIFSTLHGAPKLTIVLVIDQFAAHYLPKLDPYLSHGIHQLLKNGVVYTNAYLPYGATSTAVGHTSLSTGALPKDHGIIGNTWFDMKGNKILSDQDESSKNIMVPTFNKPFLKQNKNNKAVSISLKSRASLGMAGKTAPAIWFNKKIGQFETNSDSFNLSRLIKQFNEKINRQTELVWEPAYAGSTYYQFHNIDNYIYANGEPLIGTKLVRLDREDFVKALVRFPSANKLFLDMATTSIKQAYPQLGNGNLLVWISLSSLDKIGHIYGPESKEAIDMIYHLDKQIEYFMKAIATIVPPSETLYVLTADHGVMPIPELAKEAHPEAGRMFEQEIVDDVNQAVKKKFGIKDIVLAYKTPQLYLNNKKFKQLTPEKQKDIIKVIQETLEKKPGITKVYDNRQLQRMKTTPGSIAWLLQNNLYEGRSGNLTLEIAPYNLISKYDAGTKHNTPYRYNTHVPLILYQQGTYERKTVPQHVWMPQVAATLAQILDIGPLAPEALQQLSV